MPTKVTIIDVVLDAKVEDVISEDLKSLTTSGQQELNAAMAAAIAVKRLKEAKASTKAAVADTLTKCLDEAYAKLEQAGQEGVPLADLMKIVEHAIPNSSAFATRLKTHLKNKGNPYRIERARRHGQNCYFFAPFNDQLPTSPISDPT